MALFPVLSGGTAANPVFVGRVSNFGNAGGSGVSRSVQILNTDDYTRYSKITMSMDRVDSGMTNYGVTVQALNSSYVAVGSSITLQNNTAVDVSSILTSGYPYIAISAGAEGNGTLGLWIVWKFVFS